jgi:hypothetical protein
MDMGLNRGTGATAEQVQKGVSRLYLFGKNIKFFFLEVGGVIVDPWSEFFGEF